MGRSRNFLIVLLAVSLLLMSALPAIASDPQPPVGKQAFKDCVVYYFKQIPAAKSFTSEMYQKLDQILETFSKSMLTVPSPDPYTGAIRLGISIGKFIAFDWVWWMGIMQACWPKLFDESTAITIPNKENLCGQSASGQTVFA